MGYFWEKTMKIFKFVLRIAKKIGKKVEGMVAVALLTIVYAVGIGVSAITAKCARRHFLKLGPEKEKKTYWIVRERTETILEDFQKGF